MRPAAAPHRLVLLGRGGALEAWQLAEHLGVVRLSVGSMVQRHVDEGTSLGGEVTAALVGDVPLPGALVRRIIADEPVLASDAGWLLEGWPRGVADARWLDGLLRRRGTPLGAALVSGALSPGLTDLLAYFGDRVLPAAHFFD